MTKYHINFEGKVYPCKARVLKCPYGEEFHSKSKIELYYKLMGSHGADAEPARNALDEIEATNRLKSLYSLSSKIAKVDYPVDIIVSTLKEGLSHLEKPETKEKVKFWSVFEKAAAEKVRLLYLQGESSIPKHVPERIRRLGSAIFHERDEGVALRLSKPMKEKRVYDINRELAASADTFRDYDRYDKWGLRNENYNTTYAWMSRDFEKFSHDLNTSKMITQPVFYGDIDKAKASINKMDNYELLATFDDYSVTDKEIEKSVQEANNFKYERRKDLTDEANDKMETWYNRNREIYENWKFNTPKRILLSMEIAKELDRRTIIRQDTAVGRMLDEREDNLEKY